MITVYTDGSSLGNPGRGGWAAQIKLADNKLIELSGGYKYTTNNRMELLAVIEALTYLENLKIKEPVVILTDSQLICNSINKKWLDKWSRTNWKKSDGSQVLNIDLWKKILLLLGKIQVSFNWIAGHSGISGNERCDELCKLAAENATEEDVIYINSTNQDLFSKNILINNTSTKVSNVNKKNNSILVESVITSYCGRYKMYITNSKIKIIGKNGDIIEFPKISNI